MYLITLYVINFNLVSYCNNVFKRKIVRFIVICPLHLYKVKGKKPEGASCVKFNIKIIINLSCVPSIELYLTTCIYYLSRRVYKFEVSMKLTEMLLPWK